MEVKHSVFVLQEHSFIPLALGAGQDHLVAGVGVDGAHDAGLDGSQIVQSLSPSLNDISLGSLVIEKLVNKFVLHVMI